MNVKEMFLKKRWQIITGVLIFIVFVLVAGAFLHKISGEFDSLRVMAQKDDENNTQLMLESLQLELNDLMDKLAELSENNKEMNHNYEEDLATLQGKINVMNDQITKLSEMVDSGLLKISTELNNIDKANENKSDISTVSSPKPTPLPTPNPPTPKPLPSPTPIPSSPKPTPLPTPIPSEIVKKGQSFTVTIYAEAISDLYGYQFNLYYDKTKTTYKGGLRSLVNEIGTIFYKDMSDHLLIGATMIGTKAGVNGENIAVCSMTFTAVEDFDLSLLSMDGVNTVSSSQSYVENVSGWTLQAKITP